MAMYYGKALNGEGQPTMTVERIQEAMQTLQEYKQGKANLENRVVEDELWFELRHWESLRNEKHKKWNDVTPTSAWLFNAIINKHADAMDNYPVPVVLPREQSDEASAKILSEVLPVVMEYNDFEEIYSNGWWEKLKHGSACYGVFWDATKENGIGDVKITNIDLLKIFWEPGVTDIQQSQNLFIVEVVDADLLKEQYPDLVGKNISGGGLDVTEYIYNESVDNSDKALVVDWYYKVRTEDGRTILHYCKFVDNNILYASENDEAYFNRGWYDHAMYPVVFDNLFPEKSTPAGFGYVALCKDPQLYIDRLSGNILENAMMSAKKRYFVSSSTNVNEDEFLDWSKPVIHVEGEIGDTRIKEIVPSQMPAMVQNVLQYKIEEMKETAANRDVSNGGAGSGVTAAAAIAALQEAGNKVSRDMISSSYRAYNSLTKLCIELIRQFYDELRAFRVISDVGEYKFVELSNAVLKNQESVGKDGMPILDENGNRLFRKPIFDLKIKAVKKSPFSRMEENARAQELYAMGFFNPAKAQESLIALDMMDFEGIDKVKEKVAQGQTLYNMLNQMAMQLEAQNQALGIANPSVDNSSNEGNASALKGKNQSQKPTSDKRVDAQEGQMTSYGSKLAERSKPDASDSRSKGSTPR